MRSDKNFDEKFNSIRKLFNSLVIAMIKNFQRTRIYDVNVAYVFCDTISNMSASNFNLRTSARNAFCAFTIITIVKKTLRLFNCKILFAF